MATHDLFKNSKSVWEDTARGERKEKGEETKNHHKEAYAIKPQGDGIKFNKIRLRIMLDYRGKY